MPKYTFTESSSASKIFFWLQRKQLDPGYIRYPCRFRYSVAPFLAALQAKQSCRSDAIMWHLKVLLFL